MHYIICQKYKCYKQNLTQLKKNAWKQQDENCRKYIEQHTN